MIHPSNRAERRRSAEAKALQKLKPKVINGKKRKTIQFREEEASHEVDHYIRGVPE